MSQEIMEEFKIGPEDLSVLNTYLSCTDIDMTANELGIPRQQIAQILNKREVKKVIDTVFLEQGYLNRFRLQDVLNTIVKEKIEEAEESGIYTNKDLLDILQFVHKINVEERKLSNDREKIDKPANQTNIQVNDYGSNYMDLLEKIVDGSK